MLEHRPEVSAIPCLVRRHPLDADQKVRVHLLDGTSCPLGSSAPVIGLTNTICLPDNVGVRGMVVRLVVQVNLQAGRGKGRGMIDEIDYLGG